jgi:hypothetical protein
MKMENMKFSSFEDFAVKTESKENPRNMPYVVCSGIAATREYQEMMNNDLRNDLSRLLKESSMDKEIIEIEPARDFLKTSWQRDNFLYFNGTYFPWRWVDTKGQNRPEREAYVLSLMGMKEGLKAESYTRRIFKDVQEGVFAVGEGGLYFPDHDNNTLLISDGIIAEEGFLSKEELHEKIKETHKKIFGNNINIGILPRPDNTPHIDTHLSVIPKTKIALIEHDYYKKLEQLGKMDELIKLGYDVVKIPPVEIRCPLNILYLENSNGEMCAFLNPKVPLFVKNILESNNIATYDMNDKIADRLDDGDGSIRCVTNEIHSKDPSFLRKLGFK